MFILTASVKRVFTSSSSSAKEDAASLALPINLPQSKNILPTYENSEIAPIAKDSSCSPFTNAVIAVIGNPKRALAVIPRVFVIPIDAFLIVCQAFNRGAGIFEANKLLCLDIPLSILNIDSPIVPVML